MNEMKMKNPIKQLAIRLAHQMDDEKELVEGFLPPWKEEEIRASGRHVRDEIWKKGYSVELVLAYMNEYKTLSFEDYREWVYR